MKTIFSALFLLITFLGTSAQNVFIPDTSFKAALVANTFINTNGDAEIQHSEASSITGIDVSGRAILDLTGIEAFTSINNLDCSNNNITNLDLSANTNLTILICSANQLTSLNLTSNISLEVLYCQLNQLTALNLNPNYNLRYIVCRDNQLTSLNLSGKRFLEYINCDNNNLVNLYLTGDTALTILECSFNQLTSLDVSTNISLDELDLEFNQVTSLDVSNNTLLTFLDCHSNSLNDLNVTGATNLDWIDCANNQLTNLDLSTNTNLTLLRSGFNLLADLNVSGNHSLSYLGANYNRLVNLNFKNGNNTIVYSFSAVGNTNLDCIQVDDATYSDTAAGWNKDPAAMYNSNCITGITSAYNSNSSMTIYPNPAHNSFTIESEIDLANAFIEITDHLGNNLFYAPFNRERVVIDNISKPGFYFVRVKNETSSFVKKLILN
jgi:Leucine-rich repeat (LRR) protein